MIVSIISFLEIIRRQAGMPTQSTAPRKQDSIWRASTAKLCFA
jgi:hypothetical protein